MKRERHVLAEGCVTPFGLRIVQLLFFLLLHDQATRCILLVQNKAALRRTNLLRDSYIGYAHWGLASIRMSFLLHLIISPLTLVR